jgi:hypothetical protein
MASDFSLHGSVSQREQLVFCYGSNSTPRKVQQPYTLTGFDLTTHGSSRLSGRRRRDYAARQSNSKILFKKILSAYFSQSI